MFAAMKSAARILDVTLPFKETINGIVLSNGWFLSYPHMVINHRAVINARRNGLAGFIRRANSPAIYRWAVVVDTPSDGLFAPAVKG